ncbi:MAG: carbon storage regulator [Phycisphaerales bacterium]|nr:carbon storage regulator [Phycisphaerales bacterium]
MLVLTRKVGERILIGNEVTVEVVLARDGKARIGVTAPTGVRVDREEVRREVEAQGPQSEPGVRRVRSAAEDGAHTPLGITGGTPVPPEAGKAVGQ